MFERRQITAQMAQELIEVLTAGGQRDLRQLRIDDLENEVYALVDEVSQRAVCGVLETQTEVVTDEMTDCPQCGKELQHKPPEEKSLTGQRGEFRWQQPVKRCSACRCDFFPSGQSNGN